MTKEGAALLARVAARPRRRPTRLTPEERAARAARVFEALGSEWHYTFEIAHRAELPTSVARGVLEQLRGVESRPMKIGLQWRRRAAR